MNGIFHGGKLDTAIAEFGGTFDDWLDLSTGINPNAYPVDDIKLKAWARLPDEGAENALLIATRKYYQVPEGMQVIAANGTQAIIELLPHVLNAKQVGILSPTYGEHSHSWQKAGTR